MTPTVLDPAALIAAIPQYLQGARTLSRPNDALTALVHAALVALGFRLVSSDVASNVLPDDWDRDSHLLRYRHEQSNLDYSVSVAQLGGRTVVNAISNPGDALTSLDVRTEDFTSASFFPYTVGSSDQPLVNGFISSNRVSDFVSQLKLRIVQKLVPGLNKPGYTEETAPVVGVATTSAPRNQPPQRPSVPPAHPEREYELPRVPVAPRNPLEIGRSDRDPFPINPFGPPSLFPPSSGDGMFVGPDHPLFGSRSPNDPRRGPWGGDGFLPPMGAPPGARFDPVGPTLPNQPRRGGPPGSGEPDNDEFMPPGMRDAFM